MLELETGHLKRKSVNSSCSSKGYYFFDCVYALRLYLSRSMLNFSCGQDATDEKMGILVCVCQDYNNAGCAGRDRGGGLVPRLKPARDASSDSGETGLSVIFSHVANVYWVRGKTSRRSTLRIGCEPVVWQVLIHCFHFEHTKIAHKNV